MLSGLNVTSSAPKICDCHWIKDFVLSHGKRHAQKSGDCSVQSGELWKKIGSPTMNFAGPEAFSGETGWALSVPQSSGAE
jgi:hypothetical protein